VLLGYSEAQQQIREVERQAAEEKRLRQKAEMEIARLKKLLAEPLAKLFLKVSPGETWGYSHSTPTGLIFLKEQPQEPVAFTPGETWDNPDRG